MPSSLDLAAPKLGSGARFRKLSSTLAARGASNPDALAAYIGRKKFGPKRFGALSAGKSLANEGDLGIYLAADGDTLTCPSCGHTASAGEFGPRSPSGTDDPAKPAALRTPAPSTGGARDGVPLTVRTGAAHALANGTRQALELAAGTREARRPVTGPYDVGVKRGGLLYHRRGGNEIGKVKRNDDGTWTAVVAGKSLAPHAHQRAALMEAVGTYNAAVTAGTKRQDAPLQPPPQQTELMAEYGIPAMRSAGFANTAAGAGDGPRMTTASAGAGDDDSDSDSDSGGNGLSPKALALYKKLKAKGFPDARALAFAKNSEKFGKPAAA